jgi:D-alanyl-D-alanine carboxypeptidase
MLGKAGKPTYARAFGMADIEAGKPATIDTVYAIASISKWLTATTVLKLVEAGKLSLDAPITTWLPDYRADTGAKVTLRRLLSNSSGVPNGFTPAAKLQPDLLTTEDADGRGGETVLPGRPDLRAGRALRLRADQLDPRDRGRSRR